MLDTLKSPQWLTIIPEATDYDLLNANDNKSLEMG